MGEGLGLGLCGGGCGQGGLSFGGGGSSGEELDLLADGTAKIRKALLEIVRVVVRFV